MKQTESETAALSGHAEIVLRDILYCSYALANPEAGVNRTLFPFHRGDGRKAAFETLVEKNGLVPLSDSLSHDNLQRMMGMIRTLEKGDMEARQAALLASGMNAIGKAIGARAEDMETMHSSRKQDEVGLGAVREEKDGYYRRYEYTQLASFRLSDERQQQNSLAAQWDSLVNDINKGLQAHGFAATVQPLAGQRER